MKKGRGGIFGSQETNESSRQLWRVLMAPDQINMLYIKCSARTKALEVVLGHVLYVHKAPEKQSKKCLRVKCQPAWAAMGPHPQAQAGIHCDDAGREPVRQGRCSLQTHRLPFLCARRYFVCIVCRPLSLSLSPSLSLCVSVCVCLSLPLLGHQLQRHGAHPNISYGLLKLNYLLKRPVSTVVVRVRSSKSSLEEYSQVEDRYQDPSSEYLAFSICRFVTQTVLHGSYWHSRGSKALTTNAKEINTKLLQRTCRTRHL